MADIIIKVVDSVQKLLSFLSYRKLGVLFLFMVMVGCAIAFWENRPVVYKAISVGKLGDGILPLTLSEQSQHSVRTIVDRSSVIVAISVVQTDLSTNTRRPIYFYSDNAELTDSYKKFQQTQFTESPILIVGDTDNNDRFISIMEMEFVCTEPSAMTMQRIPATSKLVKQICSISVPPRYGKMAGYINLWFSEELPRHALIEFKQLARGISEEIYDRDVLKGIK